MARDELPDHLQKLLDDAFPGVKDSYGVGDVRVSRNRGTAFGYSRDPRTGLVIRRSEQDTLSELQDQSHRKSLLRGQLKQEHDQKYADWKAMMSSNRLTSGDIQFDPRLSPTALRAQISAYVEQSEQRKTEASQRFIYDQLRQAPWLKGKLPDFDAIKSGGTEGIRMLIGQAEEADTRMKQEEFQAGIQKILESGDPEALPKLIGTFAAKYNVGLASQMAMEMSERHQRSTELEQKHRADMELEQSQQQYKMQLKQMEDEERRHKEAGEENKKRLESQVYEPLRKASSSVYVPGADEDDVKQKAGFPSGKKIAHLQQKLSQIRQVKDQVVSLLGHERAHALFFDAIEETRAALSKGRERTNAETLKSGGTIGPEPGAAIDSSAIFSSPDPSVFSDDSTDEFLSILSEKLLRHLSPSWNSME